ncbi:hypothetical protein CONLIGDRAFT_636927 [Coniochaeta ligniaria NRRL 30616]|uniref:Uncharacterized protein n=1 Tax=Coniochaeta ligniaria NRRL 30616 TaxID=1408157 RepID=A0A1J7J2Z4_9PEZI|nr:hypothetical protein CONLIGDRAFT_636927 [Coniochaeta ligniaria NRRL 30616]
MSLRQLRLQPTQFTSSTATPIQTCSHTHSVDWVQVTTTSGRPASPFPSPCPRARHQGSPSLPRQPPIVRLLASSTSSTDFLPYSSPRHLSVPMP